jgi:hypothetical protein
VKPAEKKSPKGDWGNAEAVVILHDKHRVYYSSCRTMYAPFLLPASYNTRAGIKAYFEKRFGLILAVRPPHDKRVEQGKPRIYINAQILLGTPRFSAFPKNEVR